MLFFKTVALLFFALLLGMVILSLLPFILAIGSGLAILVIGYVIWITVDFIKKDAALYKEQQEQEKRDEGQ